MAREAEALLRIARDELYHQRVLTRALRNRLKVDAAAFFDSEQRMDGLIAEIESALNGSPRQGGPGNNDNEAHLSQAH